MTVHWTLALSCDECGARVTWQDMRPEWHEDEERMAKIAEAEEWLRDHPSIDSGSDEWDERPRYIERTIQLWAGETIFIVRPATRYTPCPACGAKIYIDQHASVDAADADDEEAVATAS